MGEATTLLYYVWATMKNRCFNPHVKSYARYGGRGITICRAWRSFYNFKQWSIENGYAVGLTLERKNNDGNYTPRNCKWVTRSRQARNKVTTIYLTAFGETKCLADWIDDSRCKVSYVALNKRVKKGMRGMDALQLPQINRRRITAFGETKHLSAWARDPRCVVKMQTLRARIERDGFTPERAITMPRREDRTHCKYGHEYNARNTRYTDKARVCRICENASGLAKYYRNQKRKHANP